MKPRLCHRTLILAVILATGLVAPGCGGPKTSDRNISLVNVDDAQQLVKSRGSLLGLGGTRTGAWVDPRTPLAYRAGHIPGAVSLPFQDVAAEHAARLEGFGTLIVYGDDFGSAIATAMSKRLVELGYKDVRTLRGGLRVWQETGNEVELGDGG